MYFTAEGYVSSQGTGRELWVTDGTVSGTKMVDDFYPFNSDGSDVSILAVSGNNLYFNARNDQNTSWLKDFYKTDGTAAGSQVIADFAAYDAVPIGSDVYFHREGDTYKNDTNTTLDMVEYVTEITGAVGSKLLMQGRNCGDNGFCLNFDATDAGFYLGDPSGPSADHLDIHDYVTTAGTDLFSVNDELYFFWYHSDGKVGNTGTITDGSGGTISINNPVDLNGKTYDILNDGIMELDQNGTYQGVKWKNNDILSASIVGSIANKYLILNAYDNSTSNSVAVAVDMTASDTSAIAAVIHIGHIQSLIESGTDMYYVNKNSGIVSLWKWEIGTANTTFVHQDGFSDIVEHNNEIYLYGYDYIGKVNGGSVDSVMITSLNYSSIEKMISTSIGMVYVWYSLDDSYEIGITDGTLAGTKSLTSDNVYHAFTHIPDFIEFNGNVYFSRQDSTGDIELWRTDGTVGNTINYNLSADGSSEPKAFSVVGSKLYFSAITVDEGRELWETDGTNGGTNLVFDLNPGPANGMDEFGKTTELRGDVYFVGNDGTDYGVYKLGDVGVGIDEEIQGSILQLFPNPSEGKVTMLVSETLFKGTNNGTVRVYSQLGNLVRQRDINTPNFEMDLTSLQSGMYHIQLDVNNERFNKTLILRR